MLPPEGRSKFLVQVWCEPSQFSLEFGDFLCGGEKLRFAFDLLPQLGALVLQVLRSLLMRLGFSARLVQAGTGRFQLADDGCESRRSIALYCLAPADPRL